MRILLVLALLVISTIVVYGQEEGTKSTSHANHAKDTAAPNGQQSSPYKVIAIQQQAPNDQQNGTANKPKSYLSRLFSAENLPQIGLIFVGIGGIIVAIHTLRHLEESTERQLRAYVLTETADILEGSMLKPPLMAKAKFPFVFITVKNSGQTPAYDVVSWLQIAVTAPSNENVLAVSTPIQRVSANNLGPGGKFSKNLWFDRPLTTPEITDIASGARGIYLYGRIEYTDAFEVRRFTNFRLRYTGPFPPLPNSIFNFCEGGNDAN